MVRFPKKYKDRFIMTYAVNKNKNIIITTFLEVFLNLKILCFLKRCIENERHNNCEIPVGIKSNVEYILNKCVCFEFSKKFRVCKAKKNNMKLKDEDIDNICLEYLKSFLNSKFSLTFLFNDNNTQQIIEITKIFLFILP
tara:strand:+ start:8693 stop:9112 length:420 start_codon:yes stop_codon:yes gene_type:complete